MEAIADPKAAADMAKWMRQLAKRKQYQEMADYGWTVEMIHRAQRWFSDRGFTCSYHTGRREWCVGRVGKPGEPGPTTVYLWLGAGAFSDCLDAPQQTIDRINAKFV